MAFLAVDVGNSRIHIGYFRRGRLEETLDVPTSKLNPDELAERLSRFQARGALVSSVVPSLDATIEHLLKSVVVGEVRFLRYSPDLGITVDYERPETLGTDRLVHAFYVQKWVQADSVVVDLGTAITVDFIGGDGHFYGGAIIPGPNILRKALAAETALLFEFEWQNVPHFVGTSTEEAMEIGIMKTLEAGIRSITYGGAIELSWKTFRKLLTGGLIDKYRLVEFERVPHLNLYGLHAAAALWFPEEDL